MKYLSDPIRSKIEIKKVCEVLSKMNDRNLLLFILGINTGLRVSDILNLKIEDVLEKNYVEIIEQKTKKRKKFPLNSKLKQYINDYFELYGITDFDKNRPLFMSKQDKRLSRTAVYRFLKLACKKVGIEANIGTHTMRKTFGYFFYKKYKDVALLQKILNHSSPEVTLRYIGIDQEEIDFSYMNFEL